LNCPLPEIPKDAEQPKVESVDKSDSDPAAANDAAGHDVPPLPSYMFHTVEPVPEPGPGPEPVAGDKWHADAVRRQRRQPSVNGDVHGDERVDADADDGNRLAVDPIVVVVAAAAVAAAVPAAGHGHGRGPGPPGPVSSAVRRRKRRLLRRRRRRRLATIFSKSHWLPKFCIVCLGLHIYRYWDLKCTHN